MQLAMMGAGLAGTPVSSMRVSTHATLPTSLISFWELEEASGNRVDSKSTNNLVPTNTPGNATGKVGNALALASASSQYVSIADNASLSMGAGVHMSIAGWLYISTATTEQWCIDKFNTAAGQREYAIVFSSGADNKLEFRVNPTGVAASTSVFATTFGALSVNTWYFFVVTYDGTNIKIGINNGAMDATAYSADIFDGTSDFVVGAREATQFLNGRVDQLGLWKKVLTASEITDLWNNGNGLAY